MLTPGGCGCGHPRGGCGAWRGSGGANRRARPLHSSRRAISGPSGRARTGRGPPGDRGCSTRGSLPGDAVGRAGGPSGLKAASPGCRGTAPDACECLVRRSRSLCTWRRMEPSDQTPGARRPGSAGPRRRGAAPGVRGDDLRRRGPGRPAPEQDRLRRASGPPADRGDGHRDRAAQPGAEPEHRARHACARRPQSGSPACSGHGARRARPVGAKERRLEAKKRLGQRKAERREPGRW